MIPLAKLVYYHIKPLPVTPGWLDTSRRFAVLALALLGLAGSLFDLPVRSVINPLALVTMLLCMPVAAKATRYTGVALLGVGSILLFISGAGWQVWLSGFGENRALLSLIILVPLLGLPLSYGGYLEAIDAFSRRYMAAERPLMGVAMASTHFLGSLLNVGALPIIYQMLVQRRGDGDPRLAMALARGYSTAVVWSPNMAAIPLIIHYFDVKYWEIGPVAFIMAVLISLFGMVTLRPRPRQPGEDQDDMPLDRGSRRKLLELVTVGAALIAFLLVLEGQTGLSIFSIVPLVSILFPLCWSLYLGKLAEWRQAVRSEYGINILTRMKNEVVLFTCAGFLAVAVKSSGLDGYIPLLVHTLSGGNALGISLVVAALVLGISLLGVHPIVTGVAVLATLDPVVLGVSPRFLGVVVACTWAVTINITPFSATNVMMSGITGRSPLEVGPRWHLKYGVPALLMVILLLNGLRLVGY